MTLSVETDKNRAKNHSGNSIFGQNSLRVKHRNNFFFRLFDLIFRCVLYAGAHYTRRNTVHIIVYKLCFHSIFR